MSWKSLAASRSPPSGRKRFSSSARSSMACSSRPSSPISSRNSRPPSAARSSPGAIAQRAGERALDVAEQRRHRGVAAQRGAVHLDEGARRPAAAPSSARRCAAPAATCPRRSARSAGWARASATATCSIRSTTALNAALRVSMPDLRIDRSSRSSRGEARGDAVVLREIEVDDAVAARRSASRARGRGLQQAPGDVPRLGQQEEADLRDVRAGGDVDQVVLARRDRTGRRARSRGGCRRRPRSPTGRPSDPRRAAPRSRATPGGCRRARSRPARGSARGWSSSNRSTSRSSCWHTATVGRHPSHRAALFPRSMTTPRRPTTTTLRLLIY